MFVWAGGGVAAGNAMFGGVVGEGAAAQDVAGSQGGATGESQEAWLQLGVSLSGGVAGKGVPVRIRTAAAPDKSAHDKLSKTAVVILAILVGAPTVILALLVVGFCFCHCLLVLQGKTTREFLRPDRVTLQERMRKTILFAKRGRSLLDGNRAVEGEGDLVEGGNGDAALRDDPFWQQV